MVEISRAERARWYGGFAMIIKRTVVLISDSTDICQIIKHLKVDVDYTRASLYLSPS